MPTYTVNVHIDDTQTWNDLINGHYKLCIGTPAVVKSGYPATHRVIPTLSDSKAAVTTYDIHERPIAVECTFTPTPSKYTLSYRIPKHRHHHTDHGAEHHAKDEHPGKFELGIGEAVHLTKNKQFSKMPGYPSWAEGAYGFKNDIRAIPVVYDHNYTIVNRNAPIWLPGEGTLKPKPKPYAMYAWFYSESIGVEDSPFDTEDISEAKLLQFVHSPELDLDGRDEDTEVFEDYVTYNDSHDPPWGEHTGRWAAAP